MKATFLLIVLWLIAACGSPHGKSRAPSTALRMVERLDLKGIEVGALTTDDALKKVDVLCPDAVEKNGSGWCEGPIANTTSGYSYRAGQPAMAEFLLSGWRVDEITVTFSSDEFELFDKILREKFGAPTVTEVMILQNGFGAKYENPKEIWATKTGANASLLRYGYFEGKITLDNGGDLTMGSAEFIKKLSGRGSPAL